jgi:hypothetical protein
MALPAAGQPVSGENTQPDLPRYVSLSSPCEL